MNERTKRLADFSERIASLSEEKRELVRRMLAKSGRPPQGDSDPLSVLPAGKGVTSQGASPRAEIVKRELADGDRRSRTKRLYRLVNENLNASGFAEHSIFLNFGYVPDENPRYSVVELPQYCLNKNCIQLVLELVGDADIAGKGVLDVGCGRGGTVSVLNQYYAPRATFGMDLCSEAVRFDRRTHRYPNTFFIEGNAEKLPFADASLDGVTNVESSHSYLDVEGFYREVFRVLRPGGVFLYTDLFRGEHLRSCLEWISAAGFLMEHDRDITSNVLLSCDQSARTHRQSFAGENDEEVMAEFLGMPGSDVYAEMKDGRASYRIYRFRKPTGP